MNERKILLASDLHYCRNLAQEIANVGPLLPADTYDHQVEGRLYWHNAMLPEEMDGMLDILQQFALEEQPDLVVFMGDLVNTNWAENVADVAKRLRMFPCPVQYITGNHDIYLNTPGTRVQDAIGTGDFDSGMRWELWRDLGMGLIFLDLFVHYATGEYAKALDSQQEISGVAYRPQDVEAAVQMMERHPDYQFLVFGHFPMCDPDTDIRRPGRRIGRGAPSGRRLAERLHQANNMIGIIAGHQHFAHWQPFKYGFHWTLPALVEYPCAAGVVVVDEANVRGHLLTPDEQLATHSIAPLKQRWTAGTDSDRAFAVLR